jgi:hypothetical protein
MSEEPPSDAALDQETAFSLLADESRVRILTELGAATATPETGIPLVTYAALQSRVGIRDSGRFNYHLTKLLGRYVAKEPDGYRLRWPGMVVYRTLVAGLLTEEPDPAVGRFPVGTDCHRCGEPAEGSLYGTLFRVRCWACDATYSDVYVPSHGLIDRDREALLQAVHRRSRTVFDSMVGGQCPWCASDVSPEIRPGTEALPSAQDTRDLEAYAVYHCTDCTGFQYAPVSRVLLYHPAVLAFYYEAGDDLTEIPAWELPWAVTDTSTEVRGRDPWRFRVRIPHGADTLVVDLDDRLSVTGSRRANVE